MMPLHVLRFRSGERIMMVATELNCRLQKFYHRTEQRRGSSRYDAFFRFGLRSALATASSPFLFRFVFSFSRFFFSLVTRVSSLPSTAELGRAVAVSSSSSSDASDSIDLGRIGCGGGGGLCARSGFACGVCSGENGSGCTEPTRESI